MERTITFIAEHKKREYGYLVEGIEEEINPPKDLHQLDFDPEPGTAQNNNLSFPSNDIWRTPFPWGDR